MDSGSEESEFDGNTSFLTISEVGEDEVRKANNYTRL